MKCGGVYKFTDLGHLINDEDYIYIHVYIYNVILYIIDVKIVSLDEWNSILNYNNLNGDIFLEEDMLKSQTVSLIIHNTKWITWHIIAVKLTYLFNDHST